MKHIAIIGNGVAGITAARHIRKFSDYKITVISKETTYFYARTALMYIYMGHMRYQDTKPYEDWFWDKNRIDLLKKIVSRIDFSNKQLIFDDDESLKYDILILATGSNSNKTEVPGENLKGVQGLYSYQDLELMEDNTKKVNRAVIVGGGLIGIEMAEMLSSRNIPVTFLVREDGYFRNVLPREESQILNRHIEEHHIDLKLNTGLKEILPDGEHVKAVVTDSGQRIPCQFVGITIGVHPNVEFLRNTQLDINKGIKVNEFLETNIEDVYAIGDCAELKNPKKNRLSTEPIWYTARMMGETVAQTVCGEKTVYNPGVWFNSAKFFDIEYQTYGHVWPDSKEGENGYYWEHPAGKKCLRFVFHKDNKNISGINTLGIRLRHEICEYWIKEKIPVQEVMSDLKKANFDPEFFSRYEDEIVSKFNNEYPEEKVSINDKKGLLEKIFG